MRALAKGCTPGEMSQITIVNRHINRELLERLQYARQRTPTAERPRDAVSRSAAFEKSKTFPLALSRIVCGPGDG